MGYTRFGRTGLSVSRICLGCMSFGTTADYMVEEEDAKRVIARAWDLGINFFDTANVYSQGRSEEILGSAVKDYGRESLVIATKVFNEMGSGPNHKGLSRKHILWQIEESLHRLKTDYVDLYQIHRWDYDTPIEETLSVLTDLVRAGKVRYIGASSMWAFQVAKSLGESELHGYEKFASMQNLYNLLYREEEREMLPLCREEKIAVIPWGPTAGGFLTGKYFADGKLTSKESDYSRLAPGSFGYERYVGKSANDEIMKRVLEVAQRKGATPTQVAIAWLLTKKEVTAPIVGTSKVEHLEEFVGALQVNLSSEDCKYLEEPYVPQPISGHF
ncbi:MAG: aldo/keto reductase [Nitrososphaerales archaeon]